MNYPLIFILSPVVVFLVTVALHLLLTRTRFGVALRAAIENPGLASVYGINVELMYAISWLLAGALAGLAGSFAALWYFTHTAYGSNLLPSIFAASILGGLSSVYGAIAGGLLIGFAEVLGTRILVSALGTWVSPYRPLIPLVVMSIMLLLAPRGLVGLWESIREVRARGRG
jgi:branched-chain amino acid transport system permease protein